MVVFGSSYDVTVVRGRGTPGESRRTVSMGGDLAQKALFQLDDTVSTGDEIEFEGFDEPRVIASVNPVQTFSGISHWQAVMVPLSEWKRRTAPSGHTVHVSGQGARVNINSIDQSAQHFHNDEQRELVMRLLDEIRASIDALSIPQDKAEARITVEQISMELQRPAPDKSLMWKLLDRLNTIGGLVEKGAKLANALQTSGLW